MVGLHLSRSRWWTLERAIESGVGGGRGGGAGGGMAAAHRYQNRIGLLATVPLELNWV